MLNDIGSQYHTERKNILESRQTGITDLYNDFHNPELEDADIQKLRNLHVKLDIIVSKAYEWGDSILANLSHDFRQTNDGIRFTISEEAQREVLQRLLKLNHERHEEEVAKGLHG